MLVRSQEKTLTLTIKHPSVCHSEPSENDLCFFGLLSFCLSFGCAGYPFGIFYFLEELSYLIDNALSLKKQQ